MADGVKWIKFMIGCTDGSSFKRMRNAKIGGVDYRDKLEAIWFELLDFAGMCNHGGAFIDDREIPYSNIADIATQISRTEEELELCMQFYINTGMVEIIDNIYMLSNWSKYQNNDYLTDKREYDRIKQQEYRARQKAIIENQKQVQQLPTTFDENNEKKQPVMIHRAILGSFERFIGILLEHTAGELPFWLAHTQVAIIPIAESHNAYAKEIEAALLDLGADSKVFNKNETLNKRIRTAEKEHIPMLIVLGDAEVEGRKVAIRDRVKREQSEASLEQFYELIKSKINEVTF